MIITLTGPSGAGKEFLKNALIQKFPQLKELCWTTTRPLRPGEIQGVTRENVSTEEFQRLEQDGELRFRQYMFNHLYGIRKHFLDTSSEQLLTEFHIDNLVNASLNGFNRIAIGLVPSELSFLEVRLNRRGTESAKQIADRLEAAKVEMTKIRQQKELFSFLVEFTQEDEHTIVDKVCAFLKPHINSQHLPTL